MVIWSFSYNFFAKFHGKNLEATTWLCYIRLCVIMRCLIKGLHCIGSDISVQLLLNLLNKVIF